MDGAEVAAFVRHEKWRPASLAQIQPIRCISSSYETNICIYLMHPQYDKLYITKNDLVPQITEKRNRVKFRNILHMNFHPRYKTCFSAYDLGNPKLSVRLNLPQAVDPRVFSFPSSIYLLIR